MGAEDLTPEDIAELRFNQATRRHREALSRLEKMKAMNIEPDDPILAAGIMTAMINRIATAIDIACEELTNGHGET